MKEKTKMIRQWFCLCFGDILQHRGYYKDWVGRFKKHYAVGQMSGRTRNIWDKVNKESDFGDIIHKKRGVSEAYVGQIVQVNGNQGYIEGANDNGNLDVYFFVSKTIINCHPKSNIKYFREEKIVREFS